MNNLDKVSILMKQAEETTEKHLDSDEVILARQI